MDRIAQLRQFITKDELGIEIGPWFNPIAPKREGYRALSLDVYDVAPLQQRARQENVPEELVAVIEPVDLAGSAGEIERLVAERGLLGRIDYILSSHNFEHLPNPVRFLRACEAVLRPGGALIMAVPDRRSCFDYFRGQSQTGDLIAAFFEDRDRPTLEQMFSQTAFQARWRVEGREALTADLAADPRTIVMIDALAAAFDAWETLRAAPDGLYRDQHCWTFVPASLELIVRDLQFLGLIRLRLLEVSPPNGFEFYVRLINDPQAVPTRDGYAALRLELLHQVNSEAAANSIAMAAVIAERDTLRNALVAAIDGDALAEQREKANATGIELDKKLDS